MASKAPDALQALFPSRFVPFTDTKPRKMARREESGGRLGKSGIYDLNANGSDLASTIIRDTGAILGSCGILWAPDLSAFEVAGAIVPSETKGVTPIRVDKEGRYTVYLNDLFDRYPELRRYGGNKVKLSRPEGSKIMIVHLSVSLTTKTKARSSDESAEGTQQQGAGAKTAAKKKSNSTAKKKGGEAAASTQEPATTDEA